MLELRVTSADVAAQKRAGLMRSVSHADYLHFLAQFTMSYQALRARKGPRGDERFTL